MKYLHLIASLHKRIAGVSWFTERFASWHDPANQWQSTEPPVLADAEGALGPNLSLAKAWRQSAGMSVSDYRHSVIAIATNPHGWRPDGAVIAYGMRAAIEQQVGGVKYLYGCCRRGLSEGQV
jgi:hypothetical protein